MPVRFRIVAPNSKALFASAAQSAHLSIWRYTLESRIWIARLVDMEILTHYRQRVHQAGGFVQVFEHSFIHFRYRIDAQELSVYSRVHFQRHGRPGPVLV